MGLQDTRLSVNRTADGCAHPSGANPVLDLTRHSHSVAAGQAALIGRMYDPPRNPPLTTT